MFMNEYPFTSEALDLIQYMGNDNAYCFLFNLHELKLLAAGLAKMHSFGCDISQATLEFMASGEDSMVEERFMRFQGWQEVRTVLNKIFEDDHD